MGAGDGIPTGITTGAPGSLYGGEATQAIAAAGRYVLPAGNYYVLQVGADLRLQVYGNSLGWINLTAAGVLPSGMVTSDGQNVGFINNGGGSENLITIKLYG